MTRAGDKRYERSVLDSLCAALPGEWEVVEADRERPDAIIENGGERVGIELAAYVAQSPKNERYEADQQMRDTITERWLARPGLQSFTPHIHYRDDRRGRPTVPRPTDRAAFLDSLEEAVLYYGGQDSVRDTKLVFREGDCPDAELPGAELQRRILSTRWPVLARYCTDIIIGPHPRVPLCSPRTSLSLDRGWVDVEEIGCIVDKHLGNVEAYRSNTGGLPIWLVIHSDGYPLSRHIGQLLIARALEAARVAIAQNEASFDACLWIDTPTAMSGGTLHGLDPRGNAVMNASDDETR